MPKLFVVASPQPALPSFSEETHATTACGQVLVTSSPSFADSLLALIPAARPVNDDDLPLTHYEPLLDAMRSAPNQGREAACALLDVIDALAAHSEAADEGSDERRNREMLEQQATYTAIKALARVGGTHPEALSHAYTATRSQAALDALCEAASASQLPHPALLQLQLDHLAQNTSVAALCLAQYGDDNARPHLLAALKQEVERWQDEEHSAAAVDLAHCI